MPPKQPSHCKYVDAVSKLLDPRYRELPPAKGDLGFSLGQVREVDVQHRSVTALVSTPNVDRYEEIVQPQAFAKWLDVFMENPVFIAGHTYTGWSGEPTVIGHWTEMRVTEQGLVGTCVFAQTPLAEQYWQLYRDGHMKAFSVGWLTHEWKIEEFEVSPGIKKKIRVFTEVELIEVSAVAIPANRESLVRAASALAGAKATADGVEPIENLREMLVEALCGPLAERVIAEIKQLLNTDPGGPLACLIQDVVEACQVARAPVTDDVPPSPSDDGRTLAAIRDTIRSLRPG